jgi:SWI/SNF-related matrix-associated actin-dependent regulator of chromatin subfamily A3
MPSFSVPSFTKGSHEQKQALLWCINAENPRLPKAAADKPVQFWKVEKAGNKVSHRTLGAVLLLKQTARIITIIVALCRRSMVLSLTTVIVATKTPQEAKPVLGRGGILGVWCKLICSRIYQQCLGDDMGLGKTLTILSLVLATRDEEASAGYSDATLIGMNDISCIFTMDS